MIKFLCIILLTTSLTIQYSLIEKYGLMEITLEETPLAYHVISPYDGESDLFFPLTEEEREMLYRVIAREARGETLIDIKLVTQTIHDRTVLPTWDGDTVIEVMTRRNQFASPYQGYINYRVRYAVSFIFDRGERVTEQPTTAFYAHRIITSRWHESLVFVKQTNVHRYFRRHDDVFIENK